MPRQEEFNSLYLLSLAQPPPGPGRYVTVLQWAVDLEAWAIQEAHRFVLDQPELSVRSYTSLASMIALISPGLDDSQVRLIIC